MDGLVDEVRFAIHSVASTGKRPKNHVPRCERRLSSGRDRPKKSRIDRSAVAAETDLSRRFAATSPETVKWPILSAPLWPPLCPELFRRIGAGRSRFHLSVVFEKWGA